MGSILGEGTVEQRRGLMEFGELVGTAFQIKDDLLDILEAREAVGKPTGRDLEKGKITLPIIALLTKKPELKPFVREAINRGDRIELVEVLESGGSIEEAFTVINDRVDAAIGVINNSFENEASVQLCILAGQLKKNI
jgi:geranylgeranyl pyrophosphate synthase